MNDQHPIFPLAAVMAGGDALIDDQDAKGMWEFRKKDGSTWGKIYRPGGQLQFRVQ